MCKIFKRIILYGKHSASLVFWQQRNGIDLAGLNISSGTCGLIGGYTKILPYLEHIFYEEISIGVAWLF
jgi:hypothetical protein